MNFSNAAVASVFKKYEQRDAAERATMATLPEAGGMACRDEFLLPVGREVGWFLHALVIAKRSKQVLELGTSYGYSTLFLADAVSQAGGRLVTIDVADYKQQYAREMLTRAGLANSVEFRLGDAVSLIDEMPGPFDLVLLDIWKNLYVPCLQNFYPKLANEGIVVADNMIFPESSRTHARRYRAAVREKKDLQSTLLPIGSGIEVSCKWEATNPKL